MSATTTRLALGLAALSGLLLAVVFLGFALGARPVPLTAVIDALASPVPGDPDHTVVRELRVPRTLIGVAAGAALGLAGAVIQGATRNPIADPGILGLGAGASLAVVVAITWLGVGSPSGYAWFAVAGTAVAALVGPIVFVGLVAPHLARRLAGPDHRWILRYAPVLGAIVLVSADVVGRLIAPPGEMEAGIVLALVGAPVMIAVVRRTRAAAL